MSQPFSAELLKAHDYLEPKLGPLIRGLNKELAPLKIAKRDTLVALLSFWIVGRRLNLQSHVLERRKVGLSVLPEAVRSCKMAATSLSKISDCKIFGSTSLGRAAKEFVDQLEELVDELGEAEKDFRAPGAGRTTSLAPCLQDHCERT